MSEKSEAKRIGAKLQKNSGRGQYQKGDAVYDIFLVDFKEYSKSFSANKRTWAKACMDAWKMHLEPMIKVVLGDGGDKVRLCIVRESVIDDYVRLKNLEKNGEL